MSNSPLAWLYDGFLGTPVGVRAGPLALDKPLLLWINAPGRRPVRRRA